MNRQPNGIAQRPVRSSFTLIELLVVVAIIAILAAMLLPAITRARRMSMKTACTGQLNQFGLAMTMYANDNNGRFFWDTQYNWGSWPWDITRGVLNQLDTYGMAKKVYYCPLNVQMNGKNNNDAMWNIDGTANPRGRVINYTVTYSRALSTNRCNGGIEQFGGWYKSIDVPDPANSTLAADAIMTSGYVFALNGHRPNHEMTGVAEDANHVFLDGHGEKLGFNQVNKAAWINGSNWFWWKHNASTTGPGKF